MATPVIQAPTLSNYGKYKDSGPNDLRHNGDWQSNPNYMITLYNNAESNPTLAAVQAYLPEQFHFRIENQWEPFLLSLDNIGNVVDKTNNVATIVGLSFNFKFLSALIWKRTEPIGFSFTFNFDAKTSSLTDVKQPVANLVSMASPKRGSGILGSNILTAPGPTLANPGANISMKIGRFFYCDSVIIDSLDITWFTAFESGGDPIAADVEVSLRCWYTPDRDDILSYFGMGDSTIASYIKSVPQDYSHGPSVYSPLDSPFAKKVFGFFNGGGNN